MSLKARDKLILWVKAAGRCSFPGCRKELTWEQTAEDRDVLIGEIAHIVSSKPNGPRSGDVPQGGEIDAYENTVLLCREHHVIIDRQVNTYPALKLHQMKQDHEEWVRSQLSKEQRYQGIISPLEIVSESLYSTLLPITNIPEYVYIAPCERAEADIRDMIVRPEHGSVMLPYIVRGGNLLTFDRLTEENTCFRKVIDSYSAEACYAPAWWADPDQYRWYVELLNRTINKLTGRKGLNFDREHRRYYFEPEERGVEKKVSYKSISGKGATRKVCWNPRFKHDNEPKSYWEHLAVSLQFYLVAQESWCLSIRPERRFTRDGFTPLAPKNIGRRSTSRKSHMYNLDVLKEVQFWRDFLSESNPRIICSLGGQSLVIENAIIQGEIRWPQIPEDVKRRLTVDYEEDLFTMADLREATDTGFEDPDEVFASLWSDEENREE
jgi:hypothetical protein